MKKLYDAIIIGGGAAGLSAALWCDDLGLSAIVLEREAMLGGQLLRVYNRIENHLGASAENGRELRDQFLEQIEKRRFVLKMNAEIARADLQNKIVFLASGEELCARSMIIAAGVSRRRLSVEGEKKFQGRGILESGKLQHDLAENKSVVIIGGGDAAVENALILAENAEKVTIIHRSGEFRARGEFLEKARRNAKIDFLNDTVVRKFTGDEMLSGIEIENRLSGEISRIASEVALIRIGVEPNTQLFDGQIALDKSGYIKVNAFCETNVAGVYAAGDVANPVSPTVSTAVGMGATAVKSILQA